MRYEHNKLRFLLCCDARCSALSMLYSSRHLVASCSRVRTSWVGSSAQMSQAGSEAACHCSSQ